MMEKIIIDVEPVGEEPRVLVFGEVLHKILEIFFVGRGDGIRTRQILYIFFIKLLFE